MLSLDQIDRYHRDGFLAIEDFATPAACAAIKARAEELVDAFEPSDLRTVFTTDGQQRHSNREFFDSAASIWCFFEADAFGPDGELRHDKGLSINKIGHAMHDLDPVFEAFSYTPALARIAEDIGLRNAVALQSMYIFKQPLIGGEVGCHQDAAFLYTDPITVTGFWFAIEDATIENGCLWAQAGGHLGPLREQFRRTGGADDGTTFVALDDTPLPTPPNDLTPIVVPAGTMVVLHGLLPHWSDVNRSPVSRHAYSLHCIDAAADYPAWNWLQRPPELPLRSLSATAAEVAGAGRVAG